MKLLTDYEIKSKIENEVPPLIAGTFTKEWQAHDSPIQASSIDLRIGMIQTARKQKWWRPGRVEKLSQKGDKQKLETGAIAVLTTDEYLNFPPTIAAIGFPPSHVSIKGLLMTNPGHVDPGYRGRLHFTVINMGKEPIPLIVGDSICTLLLFELDAAVNTDWTAREKKAGKPIDPQTPFNGLRDRKVRELGSDFINLEERAKSIANSAVRRAGFLAAAVAAVLSAVLSSAIAIASQVAPYYVTRSEDLKKDYAVAEQQINNLQKQIDELPGHPTENVPSNNSAKIPPKAGDR